MLIVHVFLTADFVFLAIYLPFCAMGFEGLYCVSGKRNVMFAILTAVWLVLLNAITLFLRLRRRTYSDYPLLVSYFLLLFLAGDHFLKLELSPAFGHMFSLLNLLFMTVYRGFHVKLIHIIGNLVFYLALYIEHFGIDKKDLVFVQLTVYSLLLILVIYSREKTEMRLFFNNYSFEKEKKGINDMFEVLPEGLLIFSKAMKLVFANESIKALYEEQELEKLGSKFVKETKKKPSPEINNPAVSNSEVSEPSNSNVVKKTGQTY